MTCSRCEVVPRPVSEPEVIALFSPVPHLFAKARSLATGAGAVLRKSSEDIALLKFPSGEWAAFLRALAARTSAVERRDLRLASLPDTELDALSLARAAFAAPSAEHWCAQLEHGWLIDVLEQRCLLSHYQPIVDVRTQTVHGYESLLRAHAPDGGVVSAGRIIEAARQLDLLFMVDQQARQAAILGAPMEALVASRLFINFLPTVIYDPAMCLATTWRALERTPLRPEDVVFEVVESEHVPDVKALVKILEHYRAKGFRIALDDLGAGYSSLNLLSQLRPDYVKLDMDLVRHAPSDPLRAGLLDAIARLARENGIEVIAEGIETEEQARFLQSIGIHLLQGYFFARPALRPEVTAEALHFLKAHEEAPPERFPARVEGGRSVRPNRLAV